LFIAAVVVGVSLFADPADPIATVEFVFVVVTFASQVLEVLSGRTIGKLVTGTKVVDHAGNKPTPRQLVVRRIYAARALLTAISLVRDPRGRHDRLSRTLVVSTRDG